MAVSSLPHLHHTHKATSKHQTKPVSQKIISDKDLHRSYSWFSVLLENKKEKLGKMSSSRYYVGAASREASLCCCFFIHCTCPFPTHFCTFVYPSLPASTVQTAVCRVPERSQLLPNTCTTAAEQRNVASWCVPVSLILSLFLSTYILFFLPFIFILLSSLF